MEFLFDLKQKSVNRHQYSLQNSDYMLPNSIEGLGIWKEKKEEIGKKTIQMLKTFTENPITPFIIHLLGQVQKEPSS